MPELTEAERVLLHIVSGLLHDRRDREQAEVRKIAGPPQSRWEQVIVPLRRWWGLTRRDDNLAAYRRLAAIKESDRLIAEGLQAINGLLNPPEDLPRIGPVLLPPGLNDPPDAS